MKKLILIFALLFTTPSYAEWKLMDEFDDIRLFIDLDRIKKRDGYIYFWVMSDGFASKQYLSSITHHQAVCKPFKYRFLNFYAYKQPMGRGSYDELPVLKKDKDWKQPVAANNLEAELMNFICSH